MARDTYEDWIPVEAGSEPIIALVQNSVTERLARPENMASDTKQVPRFGDFTVAAVAKGAGYTETTTTNDYVELIARKAGGVKRIAEEDLTDATVDILRTNRTAAASSLAKFFDNATLATTGAANGTTVLYTSVYKAVRTTNPATNYTADANYVTATAANLAATDGTGYKKLSRVMGLAEASEFFDDAQVFVAASPAFRAVMRDILGSDGKPVFVDAQGQADVQDRLFGRPINWSMGMRTSAVNTQKPTGNPLLIVGSRDLLIKGMAKLSPEIADANPGFALQRARNGVGFLTDEALMKAAMRRGFAIGHESAFAVLELVP